MALLSVLFALPFLFSGCDLVSSDDSDDDTTLLSLLLLTNSTSSSGGCNSCVTNNDSSLPAWIKDNFTCMTITVSGGNYVFSTSDLPPYSSGYYSTSSGCYTNDFPSGNSANPNVISSQNITLTIPATPNTSGSTTTTGPMGVGVNGVVLFNEDAAPGDTLSAELDTMDSANGHPTDIGMYHYHTEPYKLTNNNSALVGIALDGYPIFGRLETDSSTPGTSTPALDANGGHTHVHSTIGSSIYHYHVENTSNNLILLEDFHGSKGSTTF
ncbi:MAG: YHYH protein [Leptospiraceae bacterium]|nr:YHYH protein [Leptospiraceae bacterium]